MSRSKTTSIKRPDNVPASKANNSRLGDITRSIPIDKRVSRRPKFALFAGLGVLSVLAAMAAAVLILPLGTWQDQSDDLVNRRAQVDELRRVNGQLQAEVDRLRTDDGITEAAREELGFVKRGEDRTSILPLPKLPNQLPDGWPYNVVTEIIAARTAGPPPNSTD